VVLECSKQLPALRQQIPDTETTTEVLECSEQLPVLSDSDVAHLLQGLEETFSASEVDELLKGLETVPGVDESGELLETSVINGSGDCCAGVFGEHYVDNEVRAVMNMDVDDFVV
jgi:hypothetical protein